MVLTDGAGFPLWFPRQVLFDTLRQYDLIERVRGRDDRVEDVPDGHHDLPGVRAEGLRGGG